MSADVYSLTIIIFELFSGIDPFPGSFGQIFEAKMTDKKPALPSNFPTDLKELIIKGWSKDPNARPPIDNFKSALMEMLTEEGKYEYIHYSKNTYSPKTTFSEEFEAFELDTLSNSKALPTNKEKGNLKQDLLE